MNWVNMHGKEEAVQDRHQGNVGCFVPGTVLLKNGIVDHLHVGGLTIQSTKCPQYINDCSCYLQCVEGRNTTLAHLALHKDSSLMMQ